jgi:hypothetical protein
MLRLLHVQRPATKPYTGTLKIWKIEVKDTSCGRVVGLPVCYAMGCTHRWYITSFQDLLFFTSALKGPYTSTPGEVRRVFHLPL